MSQEEWDLANRVADHSKITIPKLMKAIEYMAEETRKLNDGTESEYHMLDIGNMFIDCCDRANAVPTPASVPKDCTSAYVGGKGANIITEPREVKQNVAMMYQSPQNRRLTCRNSRPQISE